MQSSNEPRTNEQGTVERAVRERYSAAAREIEQNLCCPTAYDPKLLAVIPEEVLARDYGCGNPTRYLRQGETVLDLGSGAGKIGFLAAQIVGPAGHVIGVDMNDEMLAVARWSGCISGALREDLFLSAFERAGFYGMSIVERQQEAWRTVEGIEFRSVTVAAYKGKEGPC